MSDKVLVERELLERIAIGANPNSTITEMEAGWKGIQELREMLTHPIAAQSAPDERDLKGLVEVLNEAADILEAVGQSVPDVVERCKNWRWPLADELSGFACMLADAWQRAQSAPVVPEGWSKSLGSCWPSDEDYPQGDWSIGTVDEDGNRYEVVRVEASQYDAEGESQKIAEAIVRLWGSAAPQPAARQEQGDEVQRLREDAALYREIERAAGSLPEGWIIRLGVELGAGYVELYDPDGCQIEFATDHERLNYTVVDALEAALSASAEGKA